MDTAHTVEYNYLTSVPFCLPGSAVPIVYCFLVVLVQAMGPSFDSTLGAMLVGFSISAVFFGVFLLQVYNYCSRYPTDKLGYKLAVLILCLLETTHQAFVGHAVYYYTVTNYLNLLALNGKPIWSLTFQVLVGAIIGTIVKFFFTLRVWRFSNGNVWLSAFLFFLTFGQLGLAIAYTVQGSTIPALPDIDNLRALGTSALGISVLNDMSVAIALCYYLQAMRYSYSQNSFLIRTLTLYALNTGLLTSALSFSTLIIYNCMPKNLVFVGCYFVLSKLYAMSFVAALNTRQTMRIRDVDDIDDDPKRPQLFPAEQRSRSLSIPLQAPTPMGDPIGMELSQSEENVTGAPMFGRALTMKQHRLHHSVSW